MSLGGREFQGVKVNERERSGWASLSPFSFSPLVICSFSDTEMRKEEGISRLRYEKEKRKEERKRRERN